MKTVRAAALMLLLPALAAALVQAYSVAPIRASWSGKAHPVDGVSELVTCCWDQLDEASGGYELFCGDQGHSGLTAHGVMVR